LIAKDKTNQDGSQTYFILDPCPSEDCVDDSQEIELIDLTDEYQVKNTGAIAVVSTNSTGALEITLKTPEEEMDVKSLPEVKNSSSDIAGSTDDITIVDMMTDDDTVRPVKVEDEDVDVEEISIHDISIEGSLGQQSEPEVIDISDGGQEHQQNQNDHDDDTEEDTLYIDDAKYNDLQEEFAQESVQQLQTKGLIMPHVKNAGQENSSEEPKNIGNNVLNNCNVIDTTGLVENRDGVVYRPQYTEASNNNQVHKEALIHGQLIEIPTGKPNIVGTNEAELTDSTNTALTLLELAGSTCTLKNVMEVVECKGDPDSVYQSAKTNVGEVEHEVEPTLTTLQPVGLDPPVPSILVSKNFIPTVTELELSAVDPTPKDKTDISSTPKLTGSIPKTAEELVQRLKDGDTPRQLLGKDGKRNREALFISPLLTRAEIAQEFEERQLQKNPYTEPNGGDFIFAKKLAHRLATKIVPPELSTPQPEENRTETKEDEGNATLKPRNSLSSDNDSVLKSSTEGEKGLKKNYAISDKIELLKILEDDPDDPDVNQIILEQKVKSDRKKSTHAPLIKMHPELEKELALKQLQDFNQGGTRGKKRVSFTPDKRIKVEKNNEHNNNLNSTKKHPNEAKKRVSGLIGRPPKKIKKEEAGQVTADPSQITETITVEGQTLIDDLSTKDGKSLKQYSNKRLSRSSETPPRLLPMDIVMNGLEDSPSEISSKNKIFKATNPRKRKEELQEKRQKHISNVFQSVIRNKPQKKRGRPPKKKIYPTDDELNEEFLLRATLEGDNGVEENHEQDSNQGSSSPDKEKKPIKTKKMREIERLLGDEGAINMLYSVEQKRASGGESKRGMLPSYRRKKKDLILKTKLVKSAVLRLTTNPPLTTGRISLRGQAPKEGESEENEANYQRKMSVDSHDSHHSLSSPPPEAFPFPAKIVPAEASRIIRRHSSSSNYSSRSNSPRRLSVDGDRINTLPPEMKTNETEQVDPTNSKQKHVKTTPQQSSTESVKKSQSSSLESVKKSHDKSSEGLPVEKPKESISKNATPQLKPILDSKKIPTSVKSKSNVPAKIESPRLRGRRRIFVNKGSKNTELNTSLAAAVEDFAKENKSGGKNIPVDTPKKSTTVAVPSAKAVYRKTTETVRKRTPKLSKVYKELTLKRHDQVVEISLTPVSTILHNAFNTNVLQELTSVLSGLSKDDNCHVVLITSQGAVFCQGVDFPSLVKPTPEQRKVAAFEMVVAIKEFVKSVGMLARPVVAAVHAPAVGMGVTMLPLCDVVLAAVDTTFHTPYARLGHVPEGAATLTFPSHLGQSTTSELLFACRKFGASEAQQAGLVTRVLPTENFREEVLSIAKAMSSLSAQAMNATKMLLRHSLLTGLETTLMSESHLLTKQWLSDECQANFASALEKGEYVLAVPPTINPPPPAATPGQSTPDDGDGPK